MKRTAESWARPAVPSALPTSGVGSRATVVEPEAGVGAYKTVHRRPGRLTAARHRPNWPRPTATGSPLRSAPGRGFVRSPEIVGLVPVPCTTSLPRPPRLALATGAAGPVARGRRSPSADRAALGRAPCRDIKISPELATPLPGTGAPCDKEGPGRRHDTFACADHHRVFHDRMLLSAGRRHRASHRHDSRDRRHRSRDGRAALGVHLRGCPASVKHPRDPVAGGMRCPRLGRMAGRGLGCLVRGFVGFPPGGYCAIRSVACFLGLGAFTGRGFGGCGVWCEPAGTGGTARGDLG